MEVEMQVKRRPGAAATEEQRRRRVVKGFTARTWTVEQLDAINDYLDRGVVGEDFPDCFRELHDTVI